MNSDFGVHVWPCLKAMHFFREVALSQMGQDQEMEEREEVEGREEERKVCSVCIAAPFGECNHVL